MALMKKRLMNKRSVSCSGMAFPGRLRIGDKVGK